MKRIPGLLAGALAALALHAQSTAEFRAMNTPVEPFRIVGELYYVGAANVTSLLIATPDGHILIDGGFPETAPLIHANLRKLGFRMRDVKALLSTHAHQDHAGGLAELKKLTRAKLYAGERDIGQLSRGGTGDFAFGDTMPFPPVTADVAVKEGDEVTVGNVTVRAVETPGHTKGCISWVFSIPDPQTGRTYKVVFIGGSTAPGYQLVNNEQYPEIVSDFEATFRKLRALECDILIEGHGFTFGLKEKMAGERSFVDPEGCRERIDVCERDVRNIVAAQSGAK